MKILLDKMVLIIHLLYVLLLTQLTLTSDHTGSCGPDGQAQLISIEFDVLAAEEGEAVTIAVCHHAAAAATLWARHTLHDELAARDTGNNRPSFDPEFFDFDVDHFYKV